MKIPLRFQFTAISDTAIRGGTTSFCHVRGGRPSFFWFAYHLHIQTNKEKLGQPPQTWQSDVAQTETFKNTTQSKNHLHYTVNRGEQRGRFHVNWQSKVKIIKTEFLPFSLSVPSQLIVKICLYGGQFDTSHCPHDTFWLHFANSPKLWENIMYQINLIELHSGFLHSISFLKVLRNWQSVVKMCYVDNVMYQNIHRTRIF